MSVHSAQFDWPPPIGAPLCQCCWQDVWPYDPAEWVGRDPRTETPVGLQWWDTWAEYWADAESDTLSMGPEEIAAFRAKRDRYL